MDATITVRDFSGGLNTTTDESRLKSNFTASMSNVEVTDARVITSRRGYQAITATAVRTGSEIKGLYRFYTKGGSKKWIALAGTALFVATDANRTTYGSSQVEAITATSSTVSDTSFDGGQAVAITATGVTYTLPIGYSTDIRIRWYGDSLHATVDGVDKGTFTNGGECVIAGLSATNHSVVLTNTSTRNDKSMKLAPAGAGKYRARKREIHALLGSGGIISMWFYDDGTNYFDSTIGTKVVSGTTLLRMSGVGVIPANSTTKYQVYNGTAWVSTNVTRTTGWHHVEIDTRYDAATADTEGFLWTFQTKLDGSDLGIDYGYTIPAGTVDEVYVSCVSRSKRTDSTSVSTYYDELRINRVLHEDFDDLDDWTVDTYTSMSTDNDAVSTTQKTTGLSVYVDTVTWQATPSWTRICSMSATADRLAAATYNDALYFGSRYDALRYYTASGTLGTITASGTAPAADMLLTKQQRLFAIGKNSDRGLIEYTDVDQPQDWTGGGSLRPWAKDSGADATGMAKWNDSVFLFSQSRTRALSIQGAANEWVNKELSDVIGCIAPDTVEVTPNSVIFLAPSGVRAYGLIAGIGDTDGSGFLHVSRDITPTIERINKTYAHKAQAAFFDNKYYLSVPLDTSTTNNVTLVYRMPENGQQGSWTKYDYGFRTLYVARGDENYLYGGGYDGHIYRLEYGNTDAGTAISWHWRTPPLMDSAGYSQMRHYRRCHLGVAADAATTITVTPYSDDTTGGATVQPVTASSDAKPVRFPMNARGRSLGVDLSSTGSEQPITVSELTLTYVPGRMR